LCIYLTLGAGAVGGAVVGQEVQKVIGRLENGVLISVTQPMSQRLSKGHPVSLKAMERAILCGENMRSFILMTLLWLFLPFSWSSAATLATMEIGIRGGKDDVSHNLEESYVAAEVYLLKLLPWHMSLNDHVSLSSRIDMGITLLEASDKRGCMLAAGADMVIGLWNGNTEVEIGFRPTWMTEQEYGEDDFGGGLQFTSHVGLTVGWQPVVINYRFQHTSNGGIYDTNPGFNLHMVGIGYRF
jgi:hypothetical protein